MIVLAHLSGWVFHLFGAIVLIGFLGYCVIAGAPKEINRHLDRLDPVKPTRMERLRAWAQR